MKKTNFLTLIKNTEYNNYSNEKFLLIISSISFYILSLLIYLNNFKYNTLIEAIVFICIFSGYSSFILTLSMLFKKSIIEINKIQTE